VQVPATDSVPGPLIVVVCGKKGGIGKTQLAVELAAAWSGVLVDLDWDPGGCTRGLGFAPSTALMQALELGGKPPRPRSSSARPDVVLSHPDLVVGGWKPDEVTERIVAWAAEWGRPVVCDTHPGSGELVHGALAAAHVALVPVPLKNAELNAAEAFVQEFGADYPLVLVPSMVPPIPPARQLRRLREIAGDLPVAPPISRHEWIGTRGRRSAVVLMAPSNRTMKAAGEYLAVARYVLGLGRG
jgi:chromosome partitioning protein